MTRFETNLTKSHEIKGYTGAGYVEFNREKAVNSLLWKLQIPVTGCYILECRYINSWDRRAVLKLTINDEESGELELWNSGSRFTWAWDRKIVNLAEGENVVSLAIDGNIFLDHLNVLYAGKM